MRALKVATCVGPVLIVINQGDVILRYELNGISFLKMGLTFLVPYCVSTISNVATTKNFRHEKV